MFSTYLQYTHITAVQDNGILNGVKSGLEEAIHAEVVGSVVKTDLNTPKYGPSGLIFGKIWTPETYQVLLRYLDPFKHFWNPQNKSGLWLQ